MKKRNNTWNIRHWTIYSATTFLEKCRKVVLEKWFCKLGFYFLVNHFSLTRFLVDLWYKTTFVSDQPLFLNHISRTIFLEQYFSDQISKSCKNRGCRIKGWLSGQVICPGKPAKQCIALCYNWSSVHKKRNQNLLELILWNLLMLLT